MKSNKPIKAKISPYIILPMIIGIMTGVLIFLFKLASTTVMHWSEHIYEFVRENPAYLPLLILGAAAIGSVAALVLKRAKECRGGGIPTAVASIRGLIPLKWVQGVFALFGSALLTYFAGVPLGNEGPSVQMGAAVGKGGSSLSRKDKLAYERYLMTGGACAGFAIATGAPLSGILFALEEAHRKFSTSLFVVASISVLSGIITQRYLSFFFDVNVTFFDFTIDEVLPMQYLWAAIIIGVACGIASLAFTKLYRVIRRFSKTKAGRIPFMAKFVIIFALTAAFGFISSNFVGTGHAIIEDIRHGKTLWYLILIALFVRAIIMIYANNEGVTGGVFVPNLAFGAMIASLIAEALIAIGLVDGQYFAILVVVGMASFLAASSRTPVTAIAFAAEALCVASNIIPVVFGVVIAFIIVEASGRMSFADTVIEARAEAAHHGKEAFVVNTHMVVQKGAFAEGMEIRDIIWPTTCAVLSVDKKNSTMPHKGAHRVHAGDVFHLHYQTYDLEETAADLRAILGDQPEDENIRIRSCAEDHIIPAVE